MDTFITLSHVFSFHFVRYRRLTALNNMDQQYRGSVQFHTIFSLFSQLLVMFTVVFKENVTINSCELQLQINPKQIVIHLFFMSQMRRH